MKSLDFIKEDIVTDAQDAHVDHEVQMARSDCFHAAEDALTLHRMLRNIPETAGLEGWVAAKITLAADYLNTVREYLEYQMTTGDARPENADVVIVGESTEENPVVNAITRRILMQRSDLLSKYGPGYVAQAIDDVADGVGEWEEIGTSDVSGWVRQVEWNLKNKLNQYDEPIDVGDALDESSNSVGLSEMSAGSVATVVNPPAKNKAKVGTLFGGTYQQKKVSKGKK
jgi:hypothetical protein